MSKWGLNFVCKNLLVHFHIKPLFCVIDSFQNLHMYMYTYVFTYVGGTTKFITSRQEATKHNSGDALAIGNTDHPSNFQGM